MRYLERQWRLSESQRALATKHLPLARSLSKSIKRTFPWIADEIDGTVMQALVEAAGTYDTNRPVTFRAFARHRILGALRDFLRRELPLGMRKYRGVGESPRIVPLDRERTETVGRVINVTPDPPVGWELELAESLDLRLRSLPRRHAEVCRLIYLDGKNQTEVCEALKITGGRVSRLHRESLVMLAADLRERAANAQSRRSKSSIDAAFCVSSN